MVSFEVRDAHRNLLSFVARSEEGRRSHFPPRNVTCVLADAAYEPARRLLRAALELERAGSAIKIGGTVDPLGAQVFAITRRRLVRVRYD